MNVPVRVPCFAGSASKLRRVEHREVRIERRQLGGFGADEHVPHERHVPRVRR